MTQPNPVTVHGLQYSLNSSQILDDTKCYRLQNCNTKHHGLLLFPTLEQWTLSPVKHLIEHMHNLTWLSDSLYNLQDVGRAGGGGSGECNLYVTNGHPPPM